ncbi:MAG: hypothetical protein GY856_46975, partial [bacterium]|nr:hypothetical protein [bacterium]
MVTTIPRDEKGPAGENRGIIVLGMHRAGTSAVAHLLVDLGFELAGEPVPPTPDNPQGYWEPREVVEIHDQFLHAIGRTWSDPRPLAPHLFAGETAAEAGRRLREVVDRVVAPRRRWVVKDPRMCRLIPLWQEVLEAGIADLHFLHVLRSPLSVAGSLRERDGFSNEKSFLLWLRHCLEAEVATRGKDRTWLHFEQLTASQPSALNQRLRAVTGSPRLPGKRLQGVVESILVPSLVHYRHEIDATLDGLRAYPWIARAYRALDLLGTDRDGEGRAGLDELRAEISSADALLLGEPVTWEAERHGERYVRLVREIERFHRSVETQRREIGTQRHEVQAMHEAQRHEVQALREAQRDEGQALREAQRDEAQALREAFAESLGGLRQQLDAIAQAIAGERESLASI